jgi:NADH-quinone oxidoreductase subunit L
MTHGFFKALLFLSAGSVINALHHEQDMRNMGGLAKKMPQTTILMWIGSLAIIGFPFFSGYYSKEIILETAYFANSHIGLYAYIVGILTALLTAFYSWRLLFMTFHGDSRVSNEILIHVQESPKVMTIPLFILAGGSIFSGLFFADFFIGSDREIFWNGSIVMNHEVKNHMPFIQTLIIKSSVAIGILLATMICFYKKELAKFLAFHLKSLYLISLKKWYVDELYEIIFTKPLFFLASFFWKRGDQKSIDKYGPDGVSRLINFLARGASRIQSGFLYHYVFVMFGGLVIILSWFVYK